MVMLAGYASLLCWLFRHDEVVWQCGDKGVEWLCPTCRRKQPGALKHLKPGQLA